MSKELDIIALSTDVGHLPEKLEEANNAKNEVEGKLSERVNFKNNFTNVIIFIIFYDYTECFVARNM